VTPSRQAKVLITGAGGQLGLELQATAPAGWTVVAYASSELDVTDRRAVERALERERPTVVINAAAYTGVDAAEREADRAHATNAEGAAHVAEAAGRIDARVIHVSTDFVFDGAQGRPYAPTDRPNPLGVYGRTKLAGEQAVQSCAPSALIVRTAWVYSKHGHNFVLKMLRAMEERTEVSVVSDQIGAPTWSRSLAAALWAAVGYPDLRGIHHWTDAGVASRYDFAVAIQEEALATGLLSRAVPIRPVQSHEYPTPARRPSFSVLDTRTIRDSLGMTAAHWRVNLRHMLRGLRHE
jgi:dTDP-4-dehydrorhamnose reductase